MNISDPKSAALIKAGLIRGIDVLFAASACLGTFSLIVLLIAGQVTIVVFAGFAVFVAMSLAVWAVLIAYRVLSNMLQLYGAVMTTIEDSRRREASAGLIPAPKGDV